MDSKDTSNHLLNRDYLYLWEGMFLFIGYGIQTNVHDHHAVQIAVSLDEPFKMRINNGDWKLVTSLIIDSDQSHQCSAERSRIIFISIDPETSLAQRLKEKYFKNISLEIPVIERVQSLIDGIKICLNEPENISKLKSVILRFLDQITFSESSNATIDDRIQKAISIIKNSLNKKITLKFLSENVFLSQSRLVHLFKEQTGIPVRKYILWSRLNLAAQKIINEKNFTTAAIEAGFSDLAHFSRTFTRMFGMSPSTILKNSQNIQAYVCTLE